MERLNRREVVKLAAAVSCGSIPLAAGQVGECSPTITAADSLTITDLRITPIALPDPPIRAAFGCHGPYFLRNIVEVVTDGGIIGIGETHGGAKVTKALNKSREFVLGKASSRIGVLPRKCGSYEHRCTPALNWLVSTRWARQPAVRYASCWEARYERKSSSLLISSFAMPLTIR